MTQIAKIQRIRSIGNYEDYVAHGDVSLKKFNFIYAENGAGKTTLAAILHSLSNNDGSIIEHHKRLNATSEPLIEIKIEDNTQCRFDNGHWNKDLPEIEVFDSNFVASNVFTGMDIKLDNRRSLYKFVLGNKGINISRKIARVKSLIDKTNEELERLSTVITKEAQGKSTDEVVGIQQIQNIDKLIQEKEQEKKVATNYEVIRTREEIPSIQPFSFPLDINNISQVLGCTIQTISQEYVDAVTRHVKELAERGMNDAQKWINDGLNAITVKGCCPFCGQSLNGAGETIESYRQFFNEEYNWLVKQIKDIKVQVENTKALDTIKYIGNLYQSLCNQYNFWKTYFTSLQLPQSIPQECKLYIEAIDSLKKVIEEKQESPLTQKKYDSDHLSHIIEVISRYITTLKDYATHLKTKTDTLRNANKNLRTVENELTKLILTKKRFEDPLFSLCRKYSILLFQNKRLKKINEDLQKQQKQESADFLNTYGNSINHYLHDIFHTDFLIANIKDGGYKGKAKETAIDYQLTFNGQPLHFESDDNLSVKNSLSEGDKNTIAFCLFLAKLDSYGDELQNKIVVFDDPLTSLDLNRRNSTINQLVLLYNKTSQIIVLSHNLAFLLELNNQKKIRTQEKKVLLIEKSNQKSSIKEYQFKDEYASKFSTAVESIEKFRLSDSIDDMENAINGIRISLEAYLKFKYGRYLSSIDSTFGQLIAQLDKNSDCIFIDKDKKKVIDDLNSLNAISWRTHHATPEELKEYNEQDITKLELHDIYVPLTINLLFGRL
jgi:wobble nucleotide-excising tRNase